MEDEEVKDSEEVEETVEIPVEADTEIVTDIADEQPEGVVETAPDEIQN